MTTPLRSSRYAIPVVTSNRRWRKQFDQGRSFALFECIASAFAFGELPPDWARAEFCERVGRVKKGARTLDEAFGKPHGNYKHLGKDPTLPWRVFERVRKDRPHVKPGDKYFDALTDDPAFVHRSGKRKDKPLSAATLKRAYDLGMIEHAKTVLHQAGPVLEGHKAVLDRAGFVVKG